MSICRLPTELLILLPQYLCNIQDFINISSTCRRLHAIFEQTPPNIILRLAATAAPTLFSPHPYVLTLATAHQVGQWAAGNDARTAKLRQALRQGMGGLLDLAIEHVGVTMNSIRYLYRARHAIVDPLSRKIDKMTAERWMYGGVSEAVPVYKNSDRATFQVLIYSELFASTMAACLEPQRNLPKLPIEVRLDYAKCCFPNYSQEDEVTLVQPHGRWTTDQESALRILACNQWTSLWYRVVYENFLGFGDDWRTRVWFGAILTQGFSWFALVTVLSGHQRLPPEWNSRLLRLRAQVEALDASKNDANIRYSFPTLLGDLAIVYYTKDGTTDFWHTG